MSNISIRSSGTAAAIDGKIAETWHSPRLETVEVPTDKRPNIPLSELNEENLDDLLAIVDAWIEDVRAESTRRATAPKLACLKTLKQGGGAMTDDALRRLVGPAPRGLRRQAMPCQGTE